MNKCYGTILLAALVTGIGATAEAAVVATMVEVGNDIVVSGGGQVNLAGLTAVGGSSTATAGMMPGNPSIGFGAAPSLALPVDRYTGVTSPSTFGAGLGAGADSGSGDRFVMLPTELLVPDGYLSNETLVFSNTYLNGSFASLVITPGTYVWTWGSDANADSFTLNIVPEPASAALLAIGGLALLRRRGRRMT